MIDIKKIFYSVLLSIFIIFDFSYALILPKENSYKNSAIEFYYIDNSIYDYYIKKNGLIDREVKIGDEVIYGTADVPIVWDVLDKTKNKVLLISKYILYTIPYNDTWNPVTWETCSLRKWLNENFYNMAFNEDEKSFVLETKNINHDNYLYKVKGCCDTLDKVFILSSDEVRKYYNNRNESMKAMGTDKCNKNGLWISKSGLTEGYSVWWLRTPGKNSSFASLIHAGGSVGDAGDGVATKGNGVRPCIWVSIK